MKKRQDEIAPGVKLFLTGGGSEGVFGDGKWRLLESVNEEGSIRKAAEKLGRGYRKAWGDIKRTESALGRRIVRKTRGGPSGGTTELTEFGRELLERWRSYRDTVNSGMKDAYADHLEVFLERREDER
jgi:molybdate transport system regulatory protein